MQHGCDAVHVRELGLASADDATILSAANREHRIVVSRDGDFAALLALAGASTPSFLHLRTPGLNQPRAQAVLVLRVLETAANEFAAGAIVTVRGEKIRIRSLPVSKS